MSGKQSSSAEGRLLHELALEEKALLDAHVRLELCLNDVEIAARKYTAVRSLAVEILGHSPYSEGVQWGSEQDRILPADQRGRYRFLHLKPREALLAVLTELDPEASLEQIDLALKSGGLNLGPRAINAALMRTAGVQKTRQGTYRLVAKASRRSAA